MIIDKDGDRPRCCVRRIIKLSVLGLFCPDALAGASCRVAYVINKAVLIHLKYNPRG